MTTSTPVYPRVANSRLRAGLLVAALFTFVFSAYVLTASGDLFSTGDTTIRIEIAENIMGRWSSDLHGWKLQYPHHWKKEYLDPRVHICRQGKTCSTYLLGQPLVIVPFDWLGQQVSPHERWPFGPTVLWFGRLVGPLFGALEALVFFLFAVRLGYSLRRSLFLTMVFAFASSAWPDEQSVLEHGEVGFFILLGMYFAYRFRQQDKGSVYLAFAGAAIGGAAITRYQDAAVGCLAVALYLVLPGGPSRALVDRVRWLIYFGLGLAPFIALDLWYSWVRFGSLFASGHDETVFGYPIWKGVAGLLISPGKGLVWYCPIIFLLALAGPRFVRRFPDLSIAIGALCLCFLVLYGYVMYWHGDPAWGPRYIYPLLPFLVLPLGELFQLRMRLMPLVWGVILTVILASFTIQVAAVSVNTWRTWYRVISYEENQGSKWQWIAARYRYFWDWHESPLNFQLHGLYQLAYDDIKHSSRYELVPPDEDPVLDKMTTDYAVNQWYFWWASNEFNWWMGEQKIAAGVIMLVSVMLASGTYLAAEAGGVFATQPSERREEEPLPEAA